MSEPSTGTARLRFALVGAGVISRTHAQVMQQLADQIERCGIARDYRKGKKPSDHAPLFAQLGPAENGLETPDASDSKQV